MTIKVEWEKVEDLGKVSDVEVARALGCSIQCVRQHREKLGIPVYSGRIGLDRKVTPRPWHEKARPLIGTMPDAEVARIVGVSEKSVSTFRRDAGVFFKRGNKRDSKWDEQPLGKVSDTVIAKQLGVSRQRVQSARKQRGIKAFNERWSLPDDLPYGKLPDKEIAEQQNVSVSKVLRHRRKLGIRSCRQHSTPRAPAPWVAVATPLLGTIPDPQVAAIAGVHLMTVCRLRNKLGIKPWAATHWKGYSGAPKKNVDSHVCASNNEKEKEDAEV